MNVINITGFGRSGSSAVVDLLAGYEEIGFYTNGNYTYEQILMWHPRGLIETYIKLKNTYFGLQSDMAVRDFLYEVEWVKKHYGGKAVFGADSGRLGKELDKIVREYVDAVAPKIGSFISIGYENKRKPVYNRYTRKLKLDGLLRVFIKNGIGWHTIVVSDEDLKRHTKRFVERYLALFAPKDERKHLLFDALWPVEYFDLVPEICPEEWKNIVVFRDPRDRYIGEMRHGDPSFVPEDPYLYCANYKRAMELWENVCKQNTMAFFFEEFVVCHETMLPGIEEFVGVNKESKRKQKSFDPSVSIRNVELHAQDPYRERYRKELEVLERELKDYLVSVDRDKKTVEYDRRLYGC